MDQSREWRVEGTKFAAEIDSRANSKWVHNPLAEETPVLKALCLRDCKMMNASVLMQSRSFVL